MSIKVPYGTTEYQSHNHCQCDFCNSRRNVNAKKWGVSQSMAQVHHSQKRHGCTCHCHDADNAATFAADRNATSFNPAYPAPVNQTALNASRGRTGVPQGDQWTIRNNTTRGGAAADASGLNNSGNAGKSKDEQARESMEDLDRLERLLILEHKARVKASMDADALATLRATGSQSRPQVMPADYANSGMYGSRGERGVTFADNSGRDGTVMNYDNVDPATIREAFEAAHACPVTPPPHCRASHRLQGTMTNLRMVTMDPINTDNRTTLNRLVEEEGKAGAGQNGADSRGAVMSFSATKDASGSKDKFGNSLAKVVTSNPHPVGAGMVWREDVKPSSAVPATAAD